MPLLSLTQSISKRGAGPASFQPAHASTVPSGATAEAVGKLLPGITTWIRNKYPKHSGLDVPAIEAVVSEASNKLADLIQNAKNSHPDYATDDPILEQVSALFDGKVGEPYPKADLDKKYGEAKGRYAVKQPPGYEDVKDKAEPDCYGDALIWFQLLEYAKQQQKPVIFITGERKEDWWYKPVRLVVGPRPELIHEMHAVAGVDFYMYSSERFMIFAEDFLGLRKQPEAIDEVREVSQQIMYMEGRSGLPEHGGGWAGISLYRMRTARNVAAAMRLGVRDPAEIAAFGNDEFWYWARQQGLTSRIAIDHLLGEYVSPDGAGGRTPWELREAIQGQPLERRKWAEDKAIDDYLSIAGIPFRTTSIRSLEQRLGRSLDGMTLAEIAAEISRLQPEAPSLWCCPTS
jgi:hypothetical protein